MRAIEETLDINLGSPHMHSQVSALIHTHTQHRHTVKLTGSWTCLNEFEHLCSKLNSLNHLNSFNTFIITECKKSSFKSRFFILFHLFKRLFLLVITFLDLKFYPWRKFESVTAWGPFQENRWLCLSCQYSFLIAKFPYMVTVQIEAHLGGQWAAEVELIHNYSILGPSCWNLHDYSPLGCQEPTDTKNFLYIVCLCQEDIHLLSYLHITALWRDGKKTFFYKLK